MAPGLAPWSCVHYRPSLTFFQRSLTIDSVSGPSRVIPNTEEIVQQLHQTDLLADCVVARLR